MMNGAPACFPDTTVWRNFAAVRSCVLLQAVVGKSALYTEAIVHELEDAATVRGHEEIRKALDEGWIGPGIGITNQVDIERVQQLRRDEVGGHPADPLDSLGEAETLFLIRERIEYMGSHWITDDVAAHDFGTRLGIPTLSTQDVMAIAIRDGHVSLANGFSKLGLMGSRGRVLAFAPTSESALQATVDRWQDWPGANDKVVLQ